MQELIPLQPQTINGNAVETVSARELHEFLGVTERFSSWMERQFQYGFEENVDYLGCKVFNTLAKQEVQEYYLSLDCAKEISMIQKSDKGKQARKYFIECEKKLKEQTVPLTFAEALRAYADEVEAHEQTKQTLAIAEPKAQYFDNLVERNLLTNFTITAKEFGIKRKDLIDYLLVNKYVYRDAHDNIVAYAAHVPHLFEIKEFAKEKHAGTQTLVTPKGRETIRLLLGI